MFQALKEHWREAKSLGPLKAEWARVCPDDALRGELWEKFLQIRKGVPCPHNESHTLSFVVEMFRTSARHPGNGVFVEAGCYKGGSTAKLSHVAWHLGRKLVAFDSFQGLPENKENHERSIFGYSIRHWFTPGEFCGSLEEVRENVSTFGRIEVCEFVEGWFENTLPQFSAPILGAYIDVDLATSTKTCLKYLYPQIVPGGVLVSQDGDFPLVIDVFEDRRFWEEEVGVAMPRIDGLRESKMLRVVKT